MTWKKATKEPAELKKSLEAILPEYLPIYKAPTYSELLVGCENSDEEDARMRHEALKEYKAIDNVGNIYLVQNSALMVHQCERRVAAITDVKRRMVLTSQAADDLAKKSPTPSQYVKGLPW